MIDAGDLASDIDSNVTNVMNQDKASIHLSWTGTVPVGVVTVQARNGEKDPWYDLDMGGTISISGASGDHQLVFNELPFTDIKLTYTATSGTGTLDATLTSKVTGG
jgi:hypothetical protein